MMAFLVQQFLTSLICASFQQQSRITGQADRGPSMYCSASTPGVHQQHAEVKFLNKEIKEELTWTAACPAPL